MSLLTGVSNNQYRDRVSEMETAVKNKDIDSVHRSFCGMGKSIGSGGITIETSARPLFHDLMKDKFKGEVLKGAMSSTFLAIKNPQKVSTKALKEFQGGFKAYTEALKFLSTESPKFTDACIDSAKITEQTTVIKPAFERHIINLQNSTVTKFSEIAPGENIRHRGFLTFVAINLPKLFAFFSSFCSQNTINKSSRHN